MKAVKEPFGSVDHYIETFPEQTQEVLQRVRSIVKEIAPESVETISYDLAAFKQDGNFIVYLGGFKKHISLFPRTLMLEATLGEELIPYSSGKGTMQFPLDKPIPYDFIRRIVEIMLAETLAKKKKKG